MNSLMYFAQSFLNKSKTENFTVAVSSAVSETVDTNPEIIPYGITTSILVVIFALIYAYGAASLSYNYNMYINNKNLAILWAIVCFFFPFLYYPFYAIVLDPVLYVRTPVGGKRH